MNKALHWKFEQVPLLKVAVAAAMVFLVRLMRGGSASSRFHGDCSRFCNGVATTQSSTAVAATAQSSVTVVLPPLHSSSPLQKIRGFKFENGKIAFPSRTVATL
ncbi:hypothetical protein DEO72_LG8g2587 [Vigna unguiculata]|uniref:Uncharacterized protein n=1 Tax=Vigna unguiculata TaxID=3917 RepID=A0A4D6MV76_VIGUN|nr:hypothetical protein DEO72_LG8g2587 [Vigna unguiculata]